MKLPYFLLTHALLTVFMLPVLHGAAPAEKAVKSTSLVQDTWSVPGIMGGGVKANDAYVDGSFFLTVPVYSTIGREGWLAGDVIFLEPYTSWGEEGEVAVSLGLGWRHLFSGQSNSAVTHHDGHQAGFFEEGAFIGANLFVDMLDTQFDNRFWQLGFGLEAGTRYVEMRANYYLPLSDRQLAEEIRTQESFTTTSSVTGFSEPFATGHTILQDLTHTMFETTTTIERLFRRYEDGMEGWDAEMALLLPWIDRWMDVKVIGGYYAFDNQPFGPQRGGTGNVEGWKTGLEIRPVPAVVLNATWYEDDQLTGADWTAGVRLEIPFEAGDLGDGKGFWDRISDAFRPRRRHLAERMAEPVRRQNAAIKTSTSVEEDKEAAEVKVVTKVVSQSKQRIVLADTVVFVDNAIGSPTNPGTYEAPLDTIQAGANTSALKFGDQAIVVVQGRPGGYPETVVIGQPIRLIGSGTKLPLFNGTAFYGRTRTVPHVIGGFQAINIPGTVEIAGFEISGGGASFPVSSHVPGSGIYFENVQHGLIHHNSVHDTSYLGIEVHATNGQSSFVHIANNTVANATGVGIYVSSDGFAGPPSYVSAVIEQNDVRGSSNGIAVATPYFDAGPVPRALGDFVVRGNTVIGNSGGGIILNTFGSSRANVVLDGNFVQANGPFEIRAETGDGSSLFLIGNGVRSNTVFSSPGGLLFDSENIGGGISIPPAGFIFINGFLHPASVDLP